jgi:heptose-I-phosphate ethanolaminephosphotransferase
MPSSPRAPALLQNNPKRIDWKAQWAGIGWLFLFFWLFSGVTQTLIFATGAAGFVGFRSALYLSLVWLVPVLLFPRWTRQISAVVGLVLWAASLVSLSYFGIYGQEFSQSVIFVMLESNPTEAQEYLSQYFNIWMALGLVIYTLVVVLIWKRLRPVYLPRPHVWIVALLLLALGVGYPLGKVVSSGFAARVLEKQLAPAVPWQLVIGYQQYQQQLDNMQKLLQDNAALPPLKNLTDANGDTPRTLVLVIGESTTSQHMSLYGYARKTTPLLDTLQDKGNLTVFNDVIASRPYTIEMLQQALTFADQEHPERALTEPTLINLMEQAGYKTFWITNQQTMTQRNTLLTTFSQQTDEPYYLNNQRSQNASQYDQVVFEPFEKVLQDAAPKKFIIIHLLGTHAKYKYRYPNEYAQFTSHQGAPAELDDDQLVVYNSYDNAVLYNDFVVSRLMETFADSEANGFLLYFADHGEEVFDDAPHETLGRNEGAPTRNMYTVPFMLWTSPAWQKTHPLDFSAMVDRKYSNIHLIHTWSDLAGLSYEKFQPELSVVNPKFKTMPRLIGNPTDPETLRDFDALK